MEIGAGLGWQAKYLAENGYNVEAIDIENEKYTTHCIWPIASYDGRHIPFPDSYFDIVFSSNVLEHISHSNLKEFQNEIKRVLKPVIRIVYSKIVHGRGSKSEMEDNVVTKINHLPKIELIKKAIFPPRHGETGTALSEMYYFSRRRWYSMFKNAGWKIKKDFSNSLFCTGYAILDSKLPIQYRKFLSYFLGSSCHIFVLAKVASLDERGE